MLDKPFIERKIARINEELLHLKEFKDFTIDDLARNFESQAMAERLLERAFMRAIDINEHLIEERGAHLRAPRGYRETFLLLADIGVLSNEFAEKISQYADLRNALVHDYNDLDPKISATRIGDLIEDFNEYTKYVLKFTPLESPAPLHSFL